MATLDSDFPPESLDEYETEPLPLPRRRRLPVLTALLALGAVGALTFYAGVEVQKHYGSSGATSGGSDAAGSFAARFGRGTGGTTTTGQSDTGGSATGGFGSLTAGTVTAIKGSTLYVTDTSGNVVKVTTSPASSVSKTVSSSVKGINPGDTVVVRGSAGKNGIVAAESITVGGSGSGASGFGGLGAGGASGFGGGTSSSGGSSSGSGGATGFGGGNGGATGFGGGG